MPSQRVPRGQPGAGRFAPIITNVRDVAALVESGVVTRAYAQRVASKAQRIGVSELTPETRKIARGHTLTPRERAQRIAERVVATRPETTNVGPITRYRLAQQLQRETRYNNLWDFVTKPSTPGQKRYYTPSDSPFGRMAYYSKGAMARYLRDYMDYGEDEIDYILYPDEDA